MLRSSRRNLELVSTSKLAFNESSMDRWKNHTFLLAMSPERGKKLPVAEKDGLKLSGQSPAVRRPVCQEFSGSLIKHEQETLTLLWSSRATRNHATSHARTWIL